MNLSKSLSSALVVAVVAVSGLAYYFYSEYAALKANPNKIAQEETARIVSKVSKLIVLPEGEDPTVVTVADPEVLKDQPFFAKAKKGDRVLIYANARKAILYDSENNRVVEVGPINIGESETPVPASTPTPEPEESVKEDSL